MGDINAMTPWYEHYDDQGRGLGSFLGPIGITK